MKLIRLSFRMETIKIYVELGSTKRRTLCWKTTIQREKKIKIRSFNSWWMVFFFFFYKKKTVGGWFFFFITCAILLTAIWFDYIKLFPDYGNRYEKSLPIFERLRLICLNGTWCNILSQLSFRETWFIKQEISMSVTLIFNFHKNWILKSR